MNAAWLRGVRDLLDWVLGDRPTAPLSGRTVGPPTAYDLTHEENIADDIIQQGRPGGLPTDPSRHIRHPSTARRSMQPPAGSAARPPLRPSTITATVRMHPQPRARTFAAERHCPT